MLLAAQEHLSTNRTTPKKERQQSTSVRVPIAPSLWAPFLRKNGRCMKLEPKRETNPPSYNLAIQPEREKSKLADLRKTLRQPIPSSRSLVCLTDIKVDATTKLVTLRCRPPTATRRFSLEPTHTLCLWHCFICVPLPFSLKKNKNKNTEHLSGKQITCQIPLSACHSRTHLRKSYWFFARVEQLQRLFRLDVSPRPARHLERSHILPPQQDKLGMTIPLTRMTFDTTLVVPPSQKQGKSTTR